MTYFSKVVTYTANTTTGDQTLASAGFTPKVAIVFFNNSVTTINSFAEHANIGIGFTDGTNSRCEYASSIDNLASSDTLRIDRNDCLIVSHVLSSPPTTQDSKATFSSFNSDGMVINWSDAPAAAFKFNVLYLGGTDITNVLVGDFTTVNTIATHNMTAIGFQPDMLMLVSINSTMNSTATGARPVIGVVDTDGNQWTQSICSETGRTTTDTWQCYNHAKMFNLLSATTGSVSHSFSFNSWLSTGFSYNNDHAVASVISYLAIKGGAYAAGNATEPASTGTQQITTNKDCKAVMIFGLDTATSGTAQVDCMLTVGAGSSATARAVTALHDTDNVADVVAVSRSGDAAIYKNITANATASSSTVDDEADLDSVSTSGFTLDWVNIGNARPYRYLTFGALGVPQEVFILSGYYQSDK